MKFSISSYLLVSSILVIFSEAFYLRFGIDWKIFYLVIILNYFILSLHHKIKISKYIVYFVILTFIHGVIGAVFFWHTPQYLIFQLVGISFSAIYYYNFVKIYSIKIIMDVYVKVSIFVILVGYVLHIFEHNFLFEAILSNRYRGILTEPAHFAIIVLPAFYVSIRNKKYITAFILFFALLHSQSTVGYLGLMLCFFMPFISLNLIFKGLYVFPLVAMLFIGIYQNNENFEFRMDETFGNLQVFKNGDLPNNINVSSYALLSNAYVSYRSFSETFVGTGLGSHRLRHEKYITEIKIPEYLQTLKIDNINAADACSLFLRMLTDFGIFTILGILYFFYVCRVLFPSNSDYGIICQAFFVYIMLKLLRDGHYFPPEMFLFIWIFIFSFKQLKNEEAVA